MHAIVSNGIRSLSFLVRQKAKNISLSFQSKMTMLLSEKVAAPLSSS